MNCNTCRYELSQCLDGRLPSGRRAVVMQHATACVECGAFWEELQAAQRLALTLPREQVGASFRDGLWERIRAGEGTPSAVFHEPVPMLAKVRYALTGAAAAAGILLVGLWLGDDQSHSPGAAVDEASRTRVELPVGAVAQNEPQPVRRAQAVAVDDNDMFSGSEPRLLAAAEPLSAYLVADETARQLENRYTSVGMRLRLLRDLHRPDTQVLVEQIESDTRELREFAEMLLEMRDWERVSFSDPEVSAELRLVTRTFNNVNLRRIDLATVQNFIQPTVESSPRLGSISKHIYVSPRAPQEDVATLARLNRLRPEIFPKLFYVIGLTDETSPEFGLPRQGQVFWFQNACGANFVAPRSRVDIVGTGVVTSGRR
ncbi:MAG: hypothetical protein KDE27_23815 [Planctomycetes bacterium]|nr:hypothetical protein [Planctomycetota bacterium]